MNPVSFFFCFSGAALGEPLQAVVAEVTNTPWGERHCYVLEADADSKSRAGPVEVRNAKELHVSPFMSMDLTYVFGLRAPGANLCAADREPRCRRRAALRCGARARATCDRYALARARAAPLPAPDLARGGRDLLAGLAAAPEGCSVPPSSRPPRFRVSALLRSASRRAGSRTRGRRGAASVSEGTLELEPEGDLALRPRLADRWARARLRSRLAALEHGALTLVDADGRERFGARDASLHATVRVMDPRFYRALALRGAIGGAEAYMDGSWKSDDLDRGGADPRAEPGRAGRAGARTLSLAAAVARALPRAAAQHAARQPPQHRCPLRPRQRVLRALPRSDAHLLERHLRERRSQHGGGVDREVRARLPQARGSAPGDHVLEIGTGWGGFALHAAARHGCRVTTTTISRCQYELARRRVAEAGLEDRVEVRAPRLPRSRRRATTSSSRSR